MNAVCAGFGFMKRPERERQHHLSRFGQTYGVAAADEQLCPEFVL
ncbi:MAG: hypothetical protein ACI4AK_03205 [Lepagella sp.]